MTDIAQGILEVGINENGEVVINHPDLQPDENGVGHIVFSVDQAMNLSRLLRQKAEEAALDSHKKKMALVAPVDRTARVLTDGSPVTDDHLELLPSGQQKGYVVLSAEERTKGFVRPVRDTYKHLVCGSITTMGRSIAETYARDPSFYSGTFCCHCGTHFPTGEDGQFVWLDGTKVSGKEDLDAVV